MSKTCTTLKQKLKKLISERLNRFIFHFEGSTSLFKLKMLLKSRSRNRKYVQLLICILCFTQSYFSLNLHSSQQLCYLLNKLNKNCVIFLTQTTFIFPKSNKPNKILQSNFQKIKLFINLLKQLPQMYAIELLNK